MADDPPNQTERKLLAKAIEFELKAAESVDKKLRWGQLALGSLCVLGAFWIAFILVIFGPPSPETASDDQYSAKAMPSATGEATAAPVRETRLLIQDEDPPASPEDDPPANETQVPPAEETEGPADPQKSEEEGDEETTAVLDEQAPWIFAIVALLVGAFLAAGQSISFGGDGKAGDDGQPDPPVDDDETDPPSPPADDGQTGTPSPPVPPDGPDTPDTPTPATDDK